MKERFSDQWMTLKVKEVYAISQEFRANPEGDFWELIQAGIRRCHNDDQLTAWRIRELLSEVE